MPGIGHTMVQGALNATYTLVLGMVIIYSTLLIVMGLLVDLLYAWARPASEVRAMSSALWRMPRAACGRIPRPSARSS